jgi:hypothetical protein
LGASLVGLLLSLRTGDVERLALGE